jgi:hypothetical protein
LRDTNSDDYSFIRWGFHGKGREFAAALDGGLGLCFMFYRPGTDPVFVCDLVDFLAVPWSGGLHQNKPLVAHLRSHGQTTGSLRVITSFWDEEKGIAEVPDAYTPKERVLESLKHLNSSERHLANGRTAVAARRKYTNQLMREAERKKAVRRELEVRTEAKTPAKRRRLV